MSTSGRLRPSVIGAVSADGLMPRLAAAEEHAKSRSSCVATVERHVDTSLDERLEQPAVMVARSVRRDHQVEPPNAGRAQRRPNPPPGDRVESGRFRREA